MAVPLILPISLLSGESEVVAGGQWVSHPQLARIAVRLSPVVASDHMVVVGPVWPLPTHLCRLSAHTTLTPVCSGMCHSGLPCATPREDCSR